ncbi:60S ribosomal protein L44:L36a [Echinococcus multilocularis]|uniref:60S ribosomal protein L44:L36a n=1 Tax=Echinococcus multilocularis TaxID=6211 RepID=A0A087W067_ECHMU|nr:60S ribosomal protein L44:L36a [Echinococcus multilocularis]
MSQKPEGHFAKVPSAKSIRYIKCRNTRLVKPDFILKEKGATTESSQATVVRQSPFSGKRRRLPRRLFSVLSAPNANTSSR